MPERSGMKAAKSTACGALSNRGCSLMNEVGELTEKNKVFVAVCEAAVKPETFEYAKWKGIGRSSGRRGGCRSATTLRPYPSVRRPRTESASERVPHIHDLADAAYDSETIRESSVEEGNQPIIDCNRRKADEAVCHALLNGMPGNGHETQRRPRRVASLVIPFGGILCYKHWKMAFFSYGTMPLHASTDAEHEFMNCLY